MKSYDILVLGSGGGLKIALPAAERGLRVALVEESAMGGTCLNRGCIPSKMMIYPADLIHRVRDAAAINLMLPEARVDFTQLIERVTGTVERISTGIARRLEDHPRIDVFREHASFMGDKTVRIGAEELTAERIFIAVGARPTLPPVPGLAETPYMTSTEALRNAKLPPRMIILGASYIACELGHAYGSFGTETHFLVRSELLRKADRDVRHVFQQVFPAHHHIHQGYTPVQVHYANGLFSTVIRHKTTGEEKFLEAEAFLVATGFTPQTDKLGLENTGIALREGGFIQVDDCLRTAVEGVYALGDCIGRYFFRHTVNVEGEYLMRTAVEGSKEGALDYGPVPHAVFTEPEVAGVGATEDALAAQGVDYVVGRADYAESNMGIARQCRHGFVKILVERKSHKLLGAHILGEEASDMIHTLIALMSIHGTVENLLNMIYIHPALQELVRDAGRDARARLAE